MHEGIQVGDSPSRFYGDRRTKVWLECNGEPYDFRSLEVVRMRKFADEIELVNFTCPRCGKQHQSLRFT